MNAPSLTIGIEEEYQIIDPATGELKSYITQILDEGRLLLREQVKAELHQSMVEVGTEVCQTPAAARAELVKLSDSFSRDLDSAIERASAEGADVSRSDWEFPDWQRGEDYTY